MCNKVCVTVFFPKEYHSTMSSDEHLLTIYISKSFEMYQTYFDGHNTCNIKKITQKKMTKFKKKKKKLMFLPS